MFTDEMHYKLMRVLETHPAMSQRALAQELGVSLGKVNYCLQALRQKRFIRIVPARRGRTGAVRVYLLTSQGIEQKTNLAARYLSEMTREQEALRHEIRKIRSEIKKTEIDL